MNKMNLFVVSVVVALISMVVTYVFLTIDLLNVYSLTEISVAGIPGIVGVALAYPIVTYMRDTDGENWTGWKGFSKELLLGVLFMLVSDYGITFCIDGNMEMLNALWLYNAKMFGVSALAIALIVISFVITLGKTKTETEV